MTYLSEIHLHSLPDRDCYHQAWPGHKISTKWAPGYATPFELTRALAKNGQVLRWLEIEDVDFTSLICTTPRLDSLERKHWSVYANNIWEAFEERGGRLEIINFRAAEPREEARPTAYLLDLLESVPVMDFDSQDEIPLYLLPINADERERIYDLHRDCWRMACLEYGSVLEFECYRQLADLDSPTNRIGLEHRDLLETALGASVYYKLCCFYGYPQDKDGRPCPMCGDMTTAIWNSACHQCDSCRLLVDAPGNSEGDYRAPIGRYRPHRSASYGGPDPQIGR